LLSFQKALETGVDAIELDLQLSRDGVVMIFHDEELIRTTGEIGLLNDKTYKELRKMDASAGYHGKFGVNRIPTLSEYLEITSGLEIITFLELKNCIIPYPRIEEKVADSIYRFGIQHKVVVFSGNHPSVMRFGEIAPDVRLLFSFDNWLFNYGLYCRSHGVKACMPYYRALTADAAAEIKLHGVSIYPWTVDTSSEMRELFTLGVDGILTNRPDLLKEELMSVGFENRFSRTAQES
jgi:glycerophosphoryl diester phosphodiesterase